MEQPEEDRLIEPMGTIESLEDYKRIVAIRNLSTAIIEGTADVIDAACASYIKETGESLDAHIQLSAILSSFHHITRVYLDSLDLDAVGFREVPEEVTKKAIEITEMEKQFGKPSGEA